MGNKNNQEKILLIATLLLVVLGAWHLAQAQEESIDSLSDEQSKEERERQEKLEDLEKKAKMYREILEVKQQQSASLSNQIAVMDSQISKVETEIELNRRKITDYNEQIIDLEKQIRQKELTIERQKEVLGALIGSYWELNRSGAANALERSMDMGNFFKYEDNLQHTGNGIRELLLSLKGLRESLISQKKEIEEKKNKVTNLHLELEERSGDLESAKDQKNDLLTKTKGEEAKYNQLLERVERQKLELLSIDDLYSTSGLSVDDFPKPSSKDSASLSWFYSQKDSRWANTRIGNSSSDMKNWGCAVTAVAMVSTYHGSSITPGSLAKKPIYSFDLINWNMGQWSGAKISLSSYGSSHGNISWGTVDKMLKDKIPVIVYIKKTNGKGGHYVVIHTKTKEGKYVVHDPYFGPNLFLDTSRALVGKMGAASGTVVDQMIIYEE